MSFSVKSLWPRIKKLGRMSAVKRTALMAGAALFISIITATPAKAQFGIDTAAIIAALSSLQSVMQTYVGVPMQAAAEASSAMNGFVQDEVYPVAHLQQVQQLAGSFRSSLSSGQGLMQQARKSAQLPQAQSLESMLMSRDPNQASNIGQQYQQVYGANVTTNTPVQVQAAIDMNDAVAQDGFKRAIQLDAMADREMEIAQSIMEQAQTTSSGNAPLLSAQADAWILQANAYSQMGDADLLRITASQIGTTTTIQKLGSDYQRRMLSTMHSSK